MHADQQLVGGRLYVSASERPELILALPTHGSNTHAQQMLTCNLDDAQLPTQAQICGVVGDPAQHQVGRLQVAVHTGHLILAACERTLCQMWA